MEDTAVTGTDDSTDPAAEAADPATPLTRLQQLAEQNPAVRPAIAANPSTYPGLLDWLGNLGDPEIDAAIADRRARTAGIDPDAPATAPVRRPTAERFGSGAAGAAAGAERPTAESPAVRGTAPGRPATPPDGSPLTTRTPDAPPREIDEPPRRAVPWAGIMAVAAALVVIGLGAWWIFSLPGDTDQETTNAGATDPAFPPATTQAPEDTDDPEAPATDDIAVALADLEALSSDSDCRDTGPDIEVVQAFASAAAPGGTWGDPAHGNVVVDSLVALKDECGREHAQAVVDQILGDAGTNPALRTAIEADMSWLDVPEIPADAQQLPGFWVQGANMACVLNGSDVVCTIVDHSLGTPEGCLPGGISVEISSTGEAGINCNRSANADPALADGQSAYNGNFACTVTGVDVECWSTETGGGFVLGPQVLETY